MSMMTLKCPKCGAEAKLSLADNDYSGPRRCWKCHEFFTITIHNGQVTSCEPLSKEDYERQQEAKKAAEKSKGGIGFAQQGQLEFTQTPGGGKESSNEEDTDIFKILAGKSSGGIDFSKREEPKSPPNAQGKPADYTKPAPPKATTGQTEPQKPSSVYPPEKPQDYTKPSSPKTTTGQTDLKKPGSVFPPERVRTFVPQEDIYTESPKTQKPKNPPAKRDDTKPVSRTAPDGSSIFPPERFQTFVPQEDIEEKPQKPKKANPPPEK